jgi:hypothetical protein
MPCLRQTVLIDAAYKVRKAADDEAKGAQA